jgi:hypothetical protein
LLSRWPVVGGADILMFVMFNVGALVGVMAWGVY